MDITIKQLAHRYGVGTPFEHQALHDVDLTIPSGTYAALIGHTGSGKSTLIQHINGLLKPTSGSITVGDITIVAGRKNKQLRSLRKKVGMVFQYPEHQLFEETVEKDICFGPMNFGATREAAVKKAYEAIERVGLDRSLMAEPPFELSGGQMRRVAIAGMLAMEPEVLILDEPTAGLDPRGQREIMEMFADLHHRKNLTTLLVSHSMEDVAAYADTVIAMKDGTVYAEGTPKQIFSDPNKLQSIGLDVPESTRFIQRLESRFDMQLPKDGFSVDEVAELIRQWWRGEADKT
ncbi:MAG TPA: energy-coupling factor ABC transporter ATP-binding protein [Bacillales bacterium]|jgi:energy-coupling factor transport system ATP-binding protein|nr:energy-coupling factor ABC transporter ATP-binding protein [Bacillales bacterium]